MVRGFAEQSGGGFAIESAIGAGTTATLWLPSVQGDVGLDDVHPGDGRLGDVNWPGGEAAVGDEAVGIVPRPTGLILLVDDYPLVRDTLTDQLEELGHKVLATSCGTDALAILLAREAVDLMITDLSMPGMNGLTLIKKAHGLRPSLPAILLTGYAGDTAALEKGDADRGSYMLVRKPATSAVLEARVTELLERP
jgi:CheY-like chemotaxis protein